MAPNRQHRERVIRWQAKLGAFIHDALPDKADDAVPEIDALHVALLEMSIGGVLDQVEPGEAMSFVNCVLHDMLNAQNDPTHWRHAENTKIAALYTSVRRDTDNKPT